MKTQRAKASNHDQDALTGPSAMEPRSSPGNAEFKLPRNRDDESINRPEAHDPRSPQHQQTPSRRRFLRATGMAAASIAGAVSIHGLAAPSPSAASNETPLTLEVVSATIAAVEAARIGREPINVLDPEFGAVGDSIVDDTLSIRAAIQKWLTSRSDRPGDLVFPSRRNYRVPGGLTITPEQNMCGGRILGFGAEITVDPGTAYAITIDTATGTKLWRNLTVDGLNLRGAGLRLRGGTAKTALYSFTIRDLVAEGITAGHGLFVDGAFEGQIMAPRITMAASNVSNDAIRAEGGLGDASSIDLISPTTRRGLRGLYANSANLKVWGGTFLEAQQEGAYVNNAEGSLLQGIHVENNWLSANSLLQGNAGARMTGRGVIGPVYSSQSNGRQANAVRIYAADHITVFGGLGYGTLKYAHLDGTLRSTVTGIGLKDYSANQTVFGPSGTGKLILIGADDGSAKSFAFGGASLKRLTYSRSSESPAEAQIRLALSSLGLVSDETVA
jgi:hypothetical protein